MSFSYDAKKELCEKDNLSACCKKAQTAGLLTFSKCFTEEKIVITGEHRITADLISTRLAELFGIMVDIHVPLKTKNSRALYTITIPDSTNRAKLVHYFSNITPFLKKKCCQAAFLEGVFLACGTVTDPAKDYHLEFSAATDKKAAIISDVLKKKGIETHTITRKGQRVVYTKENEAISDLLGYMGAYSCYWRLVNLVVERDCRNKATRMANCDNANTSRIADAAAEQLSAIKALKARGELDNLPDKLREIALLRLDNPEASLRELEELLNGELTRSGINHRLKKIVELSLRK